MEPITEENQAGQKRMSLVLKITLLSVAPILLMGGLNLYSKSSADAVYAQITSIQTSNHKNQQEISKQKDAVKNAALDMVFVVGAATESHEKGLLARSGANIAKTSKLFQAIAPTQHAFSEAITIFVDKVESSGLLDGEQSEEVVTSKNRLSFLTRSANALENFVALYEESNARTAELLGGKKYDAAVNNFIFEEASRVAALERKLSQTIGQLNIISNELNEYAHQQDQRLAEENAAELQFLSLLSYGVLGVVSVGLLVIVLWFGRVQIGRPLQRMTEAMQGLSAGDLQVEIPAVGDDEIGQMAGALQVFKDNLIQTERLQEEQSMQQKIELNKAKKLSGIVKAFEGQATNVISLFSSSSGEMLSAAEQLESSVSTSQQTSENVRVASDTAIENVEMVAQSVDQMSAAIREIASQINKTQGIISDSVTKTQNADEETELLSKATDKIGQIVTLIQDIAEQTNLLALNATIEAARAGDAGKGFAVVASEVKSLASQTAQATEEISSSILEVQQISESVIEVIRSIRESIEEVSHSSSAVASAVEEQSSVTESISSNMQNASEGVQEITRNMAEVSQAINQVKEVAGSVSTSSGSMSEQASSLDSEIKNFCEDVSTV